MNFQCILIAPSKKKRGGLKSTSMKITCHLFNHLAHNGLTRRNKNHEEELNMIRKRKKDGPMLLNAFFYENCIWYMLEIFLHGFYIVFPKHVKLMLYFDIRTLNTLPISKIMDILKTGMELSIWNSTLSDRIFREF